MGLVNRVIARKTTQSDWQESARFVADGDALASSPGFTRTNDDYVADANGVMADQDGVTPAVGDKFVLDFAAPNVDTGILEVVDVGSGGTPFRWKRHPGLDSRIDPSKPAGMAVLVEEGTNFADKTVGIITDGDITINTDPLDFDLVGGGGANAHQETFNSTDLAGGILTVNHALDADPVIVVVKDDNDEQVIPDEIIFTDNNNIDIDLNSVSVPASPDWTVLVLKPTL